MAMEIEHGSKLTVEEANWLHDRMRIDEAVNQWGCELPDGWDPDAPEGGLTPVTIADVATGAPASATPPGFLNPVGETADADPEADLEESGDDEEPEPYSSWRKADLQAEIDNRNAERDEESQIVPDGTNKDDLIAALESDDEQES